MYRNLTLLVVATIFSTSTAVAQKDGIIPRYAKGGHRTIMTVQAPGYMIGPWGSARTIGGSIEYFLSKKGMVSLEIPIYQFEGAQRDVSNPNLQPCIHGFSVAPGIMCHSGNRQVIDFSVGPHIVMGMVTSNQEVTRSGHDWFNGGYHSRTEYKDVTERQLGIVLAFNLAIQTKGGFVIAPTMNLGFQALGETVQIGLKIGGRF